MMNEYPAREWRFEIVKHLGILHEYENGWRKELNIIAWNGGFPKYDIRSWAPDYENCSRGLTLTDDEMQKVIEMVMN